MATGIVLIVILLALGIAVWWGNRRSKDIEQDTAYMGGPKPFRFSKILPWK